MTRCRVSMSFFKVDDISHFSVAGFTLNNEEKTTLKASLVLKKDQEKLSNLYVWGKILGIQKDYFLAQTHHSDFFSRKYYYTVDLVNWLQLPEVSSVEIAQANTIQSRFMGDPSYEYIIKTSEVSASYIGICFEGREATFCRNYIHQLRSTNRTSKRLLS